MGMHLFFRFAYSTHFFPVLYLMSFQEDVLGYVKVGEVSVEICETTLHTIPSICLNTASLEKKHELKSLRNKLHERFGGHLLDTKV